MIEEAHVTLWDSLFRLECIPWMSCMNGMWSCNAVIQNPFPDWRLRDTMLHLNRVVSRLHIFTFFTFLVFI